MKPIMKRHLGVGHNPGRSLYFQQWETTRPHDHQELSFFRLPVLESTGHAWTFVTMQLADGHGYAILSDIPGYEE